MKTILIFLGCLCLITNFAACAPSRLDMDYGTSFNLQKFNQIDDLEAGKGDDNETVEGMDGRAAQATKDKYQKSFEKEPPAQVYNLTIGGIK